MLKANLETVLSEIRLVLEPVDDEQISRLVNLLLGAERIVLHGSGRVGMACRGFATRLAHLGLTAYTLGDSTVPAIGVGDVLLICSGSGETQTVYDIAVLGKKSGAHLALITSRPESRMGCLADTIVSIRAPNKLSAGNGWQSIQPMTTLNEQCLQIFFDVLVLLLMEKTGQTHHDLWARHSNLE